MFNTRKSVILASLLAASLSAAAQSTLGNTNALGQTSNSQAIVAPGAVQINGSGNAAPFSFGQSTITQKGLPVASPGVTYVSPPSNDTCSSSGDGAALTTKVFGVNLSRGGDMQNPCDVRARALNAKATGRSNTLVAMIQCQDPNTAAAVEDEADLLDSQPIALGVARVAAFRCPDRLRPQWALDKEKAQNRPLAILQGQQEGVGLASNSVYGGNDEIVIARLRKQGKL